MKSVLISIQPKWVEKIAIGKKTIEVRKTRPNLETPFKVYIYQSKKFVQAEIGEANKYRPFLRQNQGKVIGEFVCDSVYEWNYRQLQGLNGTINTYFPIFLEDLPKTCLTHKDIENYGKGKPLYGWHITDLKIYDKPKELSEFWYIDCKNKKNGCVGCEYKPTCIKNKVRPPQSYMFVESLGE